ncbi:MAG TPA: LysR family transcriptional regulator [Anaerolineales bacterium]|nr:LysR family transcriptional regulator [Anaerolineales bacterium]
MIGIERLKTFLRAAESLNFSETAKQLHLSQPTVSSQIKILEKDLGVVLFTRTNTGLQLTEAGRLLLPWAHRLLHDSNNMQAMMASIQGDVVGELSIACSTTAGKYVLPQMAARFCQLHPGVKVRILACTSEDVTLRLLEGEAHIGVMSREVLNAGLESQKFFQDTITLIIPYNHRWALRKVIDPGELLEEPIIMREETSGTRRVVLSELAKHDIGLDDLSVFMELGNAEAIVRTVAAGYGVAFVSNLASACPLERGNVIDLDVDGLQLKRTIYMARKAGSSPHRPRDAFWGFIHAPENADLIRLPEQKT